jgi:branched-subunit amino acid transport protein
MTTISPGAVWGVFAAAALGTLLLRLSFIGALDRADVPAWARRALHLVPAAVLAALVVPALIRPEEVFDPWNGRLLAGLVAGGIAWRTRSTLATLVAGMATLWLIQAIF